MCEHFIKSVCDETGLNVIEKTVGCGTYGAQPVGISKLYWQKGLELKLFSHNVTLKLNKFPFQLRRFAGYDSVHYHRSISFF